MALFFTPIFSSHFDFILRTYCMSRWRTRAAPGVAKGARKQAKVCDLGSEKTHLAENQTWFGATGFLYLNKSYHLGSLSSGPWWGGGGVMCTPESHTRTSLCALSSGMSLLSSHHLKRSVSPKSDVPIDQRDRERQTSSQVGQELLIGLR